jgi:hypothetical protein
VLVHILAQPVDPWVIANGIVGHINKDDLKVLVGAILLFSTTNTKALVTRHDDILMVTCS